MGELEEVLEKHKNLFYGKKALVVDKSSSVKSAVSMILRGMGVQTNDITFTQSIQLAKQKIESIEPHIIIADFEINGEFSLDLTGVHNSIYSNAQERFFYIMAVRADEQSVAEAADEEVDAYIIKPFIQLELIDQITRGALKKLQPTEYMQSIYLGQQLLFDGKTEEALSIFNEAMSKDSFPTLAYYHVGEILRERGELDAAIDAFEDGLEFNEYHYKCLVGLFDAYEAQEDFEAAYEVSVDIRDNYPLSSERISRFLQLAVRTKNFDDIDYYIAMYEDLEHKSEKLTRLISVAQMIFGKYQFMNGQVQSGLDFMKASVLSSKRSMEFIENLVIFLLERKRAKSAGEVLALTAQEEKVSPKYRQLDFLIFSREADDDTIIQKGAELIDSGIASVKVCLRVVKTISKNPDRKRMLESYLDKVLKLHPDEREAFSKWL